MCGHFPDTMTQAIGCISGGLDSTLAVALLQRQGIEVIALHILHLWHALPAVAGEKPRAVRTAEAMGLRTVLLNAEEADLDMVQHPAHGLGKRMNPCIDCRIWALRKAKELMLAEGAACVFTGEVVGQRPMSQNRAAMDLIEREAGLQDLLLRPLSALQLPPTRPERDGLIDRTQLLGIVGRSRKPQMALAAELGIADYPSPAGGCLVTDPAFSFRLKELLRRGKPAVADVQLLKVGRHFRLADGTLLAMGRSEPDNLLLDRLFQPGDVRLEADGIPGPTTLLRGAATPENIALAAALVLRYIKVAAGRTLPVIITPAGGTPRTMEVAAADDAVARQHLISPEN
jgi:tRNA-uridine 2-sulfurtransferase